MGLFNFDETGALTKSKKPVKRVSTLIDYGYLKCTKDRKRCRVAQQTYAVVARAGGDKKDYLYLCAKQGLKLPTYTRQWDFMQEQEDK